MVNIKNLRIKNIESDSQLQEQVRKTEQEVEKDLLSPETERRAVPEVSSEKQTAEKQAFSERIGQLTDVAAISDVQQKYKQREKQIERIMEAGLADIYLKMPANKQQEFKLVGEQTARKINDLLNKIKTKTKDIINLIRKWLLIIPGINKFFLEQEAKIRADEIIRLKQEGR